MVHSGGVLAGYVISTRILGVMPTAPGFSKCVIQPHVGDLAWAKGVFPTPRGDIQVEWRKESGKFVMKTGIPEGIEGDVVLDPDPQKVQALSHNGAHFALKSLEKSPRSGIKVEPKQVRLSVKAGTHNIELRDVSEAR